MPTYGIVLAAGAGASLEAQLCEYAMKQGPVKELLEDRSLGLNKQAISLLGDRHPKASNSMAHLRNAGVGRICMVVGEDSKNAFKRVYKNGEQVGLNITYVVQKERLGMLDAIKKAIMQLHAEGKIEINDPSEKFIVVAGDNSFSGHELTKIFKDFAVEQWAKSSIINLSLPTTREKLISEGHTIQENGRVRLKWGIQYRWGGGHVNNEHVALVEKPTLDDHIKSLQMYECEASLLTAYYLLSDPKGPKGLVNKIERVLSSRNNGKTPSCVEIYNEYIREGNYTCKAILEFKQWGDVWEKINALLGN